MGEEIHIDSQHRRGARVTISDVAKAVSLTKGTVSRALNNYPDISASTRQRVMAAARDLGYTPLAHAQAIRTGRVRAVGLVLHLDQHDAQKPFLADFLKGITQGASAEGWTLTVATAETEAEATETYRRLVEERKADGFILPRTKLDDPRVAFLRDRGVPFVLYGRTGDPEGCAWFDLLGETAMAEAVAILAAQGHTRIGYIGGDGAFTYAALRLQGYRAGLAAAGLRHDPALEIPGCATAQAGAAAAQDLLACDAAPTAIICATDLLATGVIRALRAAGHRPGETISVIGYDGAPDAAALEPPLSTFVVDQQRAGTRLAQMLIARIRGEAPELLRETARATYREGGTVAPPPGHQSEREDPS